MKLFGNKTVAVFDWWTVGHIAFFFAVTKFFLLDFSFERAILFLIALGFVWEFIERVLEDYVHTKRFFKEKEGWINRYVGDIIADIIGFLLAWFLI